MEGGAESLVVEEVESLVEMEGVESLVEMEGVESLAVDCRLCYKLLGSTKHERKRKISKNKLESILEEVHIGCLLAIEP